MITCKTCGERKEPQYMIKYKDGRPRPICRACHNDRQRRDYAARADKRYHVPERRRYQPPPKAAEKALKRLRAITPARPFFHARKERDNAV